MKHVNANVLEHASLFLWCASKDDIEYERQRLEAEHHMNIKVFNVEQTTRSGAPCTRVEWQEA